MAHGKGLSHYPWYIGQIFDSNPTSNYWPQVDYLASSVAIKHVFSKGQLMMSHIHNQLSANTIWALLCLGAWTKAGYVEAANLKYAASQPDTKDDEDWLDAKWIAA